MEPGMAGSARGVLYPDGGATPMTQNRGYPPLRGRKRPAVGINEGGGVFWVWNRGGSDAGTKDWGLLVFLRCYCCFNASSKFSWFNCHTHMQRSILLGFGFDRTR